MTTQPTTTQPTTPQRATTLVRREDPHAPPVPGFLARLLDALADVTPAQLSRVPAPPADARPAAVLVLLAGPADPGAGVEDVDVLLLERASTLRSHSGQVAFPGGALDPVDDGPVAGALREAQEETGLDPAGVEPLAVLPELYLPPSHFRVSPVLAYWRTVSPVRVVDAAESARVVRVRLADLLDPANRFRLTHPSGYVAPAFAVDDLLIWGFTGGLIATMLRLAGWEQPWDTSRTRDFAEFDVPEPPVPPRTSAPDPYDTAPQGRTTP